MRFRIPGKNSLVLVWQRPGRKEMTPSAIERSLLAIGACTTPPGRCNTGPSAPLHRSHRSQKNPGKPRSDRTAGRNAQPSQAGKYSRECPPESAFLVQARGNQNQRRSLYDRASDTILSEIEKTRNRKEQKKTKNAKGASKKKSLFGFPIPLPPSRPLAAFAVKSFLRLEPPRRIQK